MTTRSCGCAFFLTKGSPRRPVVALGEQLKGYVFKILGGCDKQARFPNEARSADFWACPPSAPQGQGHSLLPWVRQALSVINSVIIKKGENDLPGLTDTEEPRMRGPKRASKIRKLLNLSMEEDVSKYANTYHRTFTTMNAKKVCKAPKDPVPGDLPVG
ncbi:hypothetical protein U9M48_036555 [Paspalum notatum var. saurae]|uniref:Uncharacterized protein n=1 Tax=Paspalum notatum var. saurae TaxID=547442 RepID=A0AAQ3UDD7_PASNO